ncbi:hypothetical protein Cgig2_014460 [Carnegiea gigantea]|uniref:Uncharacterized protein n=1 Tax=Carnegiea gigantea TaxID=171969 RepID=A0A9Q1K8X4_9CARY|nr:hypothetical protein Cgig2_014460 [Carnegiea gigantea]
MERHGQNSALRLCGLRPRYGPVIAQSWDGGADVDAMDRLLARVRSCAERLSCWNIDEFGNRTEAKGRNSLIWWQCARSDYLKFDDANTQWFHSRANIRRSCNYIKGLVDVNGTMQTEPQAIDGVVTHTSLICLWPLDWDFARLSDRVLSFVYCYHEAQARSNVAGEVLLRSWTSPQRG